MGDHTTINISKRNLGRLNKSKALIEKIVGRTVSLDKTISLLLIGRPIDLMIEDLLLERGEESE